MLNCVPKLLQIAFTLLLLQGFAGTACFGQQERAKTTDLQSNSPIALQPDVDQNQIYLPSLFEELTGTPNPATSRQRQTNSKEVHPADDRRQIAVETRFFTCDESSLPQIFDMLDKSKFEMEPLDNRVSTRLLTNHSGSTGFASLSAVIRLAPAAVGKITESQSDAIVQMFKGDATCNICQLPTMTLFDGESGVVSDAGLRPFVVNVRALSNDEGQVAIQPVIRPIEDGTMMKLTASLDGDTISLDAMMILNQIESVETLKLYTTKAAGASVQVPKCNVQAISTRTRLRSGEMLLVDTAIMSENQRPIQTTSSRLPVVGRLVAQKMEVVPRRMLMTLRAVEVK